jgi:hypothetical protein
MIFAIDFDGTLAEHEFPKIGAEVPHAFSVLRAMQKQGHKLILWTMRADDAAGNPGPEGHPNNGKFLTEAIEFCRKRGVEFWGVNCNPDQDWSTSPKAYANYYIDDAALGCPLTAAYFSNRKMVDWLAVEDWLIRNGFLS